jgi:formylglycine-generating enzyme required for sulfatase activity
MVSNATNGRTLGLILVALIAIQTEVSVGQEEPAKPPVSESEADNETRRVRRLGDSESEDWKMDLSVPVGPGDTGAVTEFDHPDPEQNALLQELLSKLAARPGNAGLLAELDHFLGKVLEQSRKLGDEKKLPEMQQLLGVIRNVNPDKSGLRQAFERLENLQNLDAWQLAAQSALVNGLILEPQDASALHYIDLILAADPGNGEAVAGLLQAQRVLIDRALMAAQELDFELAEEWLYEASLVREPQDLVEEAHSQVSAYQARQADTIEQRIIAEIDNGSFDSAEFIMIDLIALLGNDDRVKSLRDRLSAARRYGQYNPGEIIRDGLNNGRGTAPAVVVIKAGSFLMGSPESENDRKENEGPQHRVTLSRGFALGLHEVTVEQFRLFVQSARYRTQAETVGNSRVYDEQSARITSREDISWASNYEGTPAGDKDPVLHVDWYDAQVFVNWLSDQTGKNYRLPTEAEFEYAIRAGSVTRYWWGDDRPVELLENLTGAQDESASGRKWNAGFKRYDDGYWGPAPVASYVANSLGIHDLAGNVSEWIEDCWHQTYSLAPTDGSAWVNPGCQRRVVRGGYWASSQDQARSAARISAGANLHGPRVGIRVARDL